jgi:hypothetical protein
VAQLAEDGTADQAPEPVARDVAEQRAEPVAVQAEVHDPGGDVDEVCGGTAIKAGLLEEHVTGAVLDALESPRV